MSNHSGSYIINNILNVLDEFNIFKILGKEETLKLLNEIRSIGYDNDCNDGEILEDIGEKLKVCYQCYEYSKKLEYGVCEQCI